MSKKANPTPPDDDESLDQFLDRHEAGRCKNPACRVTELERDVALIREEVASLITDLEDLLSGRRRPLAWGQAR